MLLFFLEKKLIHGMSESDLSNSPRAFFMLLFFFIQSHPNLWFIYHCLASKSMQCSLACVLFDSIFILKFIPEMLHMLC